ncbi:DoxX family protein [Gordonia sp. X0973]|uniref:DoxX family protein n=1 Tax=Gordonia sp. X0973 TaxID=2742602 RepID=UPI000F51E177|nr:DoxX family protein [Gordonia sp. X0973]QKT06084.1 DoxX family protein [Gordonia sp. X0973]
MTFLRTPALLAARIALGFIFIMHGWQKFHNGHGAVVEGFKQMNVPAPEFSAFFATWVELIGGVALILGVLLPLVGLLLAIDMIGALITVHGQHGFWMDNHGYEYVLALAAGALAVGFANSGVVSIDHYLFRRTRRGGSVVVEDAAA